MQAWSAFYSEADKLEYPLSKPQSRDAVTFTTKYDHNHPDNKVKKVSWEAEEHCLEWTKQQRALAKESNLVSNVAKLEEEVSEIPEAP